MKATSGNYSNNADDTFDYTKDHIGLRLQMGVPLLDRDWNLLEDIRRYQEMILRKWYIGNGTPNDGFKITVNSPSNTSFNISAGRYLVDGFEVVNNAATTYQALVTENRATPLPVSNGNYTVYLDVWIEETAGPDNHADVGQETCRRHIVKWAIVIGTNQPNVSFHHYAPIGNVTFTTTNGFTALVSDLRQLLKINGSSTLPNSEVYFTKTDHKHSGYGNRPGYAAIENAEDYNCLMILGRQTSTSGASIRKVGIWDYLTVNGELYTTGNTGIGSPIPENAEGWSRVLDVLGTTNSKLSIRTNTIDSRIMTHNSGFYGATAGMIIGTRSNHPVSIVTNGTLALTIAANKNISLSGSLTVNSELFTTGNAAIGTISPENTEGWSRVLDVLGATNSKLSVRTSTVDSRIMTHNSGFYGAPAGMIIGTKSNHPVSIVTNGALAISISADNNVSLTGNLNFGSQVRQMINLWNTSYGIGVQSSTQYFRTAKNFVWYTGGTHNDTELNPGGGTAQMTLTGGNLTVPGLVNGVNIANLFAYVKNLYLKVFDTVI